MNKHLGILSCALALTVLFTGCQKAKEPVEAAVPPVSSSVSEPEAPPSSAVSEMITDPGIRTSGAIDNYLSLFETALKNNNLELKDKTIKDAASLGALEGFGFNINARPLEVYLFDPSSSDSKTAENLKTAKESGFITIFGVEINGKTPQASCTINGNLVLIFPLEDMLGAHPNKDAIVNAFMGIN